jgi:transposase
VAFDLGAGMLVQRGKAYSQGLRSRVLVSADEGARVGQIAAALRVSVSYVSKVLGRRRATGEVSTRPQRSHLGQKLSVLHETIRAEVAVRPDATLAELRRWLAQTHGTTASDGLMHNTLARLGLTLKKSRCTRLSRSARTLPPRVPSGARASRA